MTSNVNQSPDYLVQARAWLDDRFAPWVKALNLRVEKARGGEAVLVLPFSDDLCREGGIICGQALMAAADTSMVLAISSLSGEAKPMTTVSLNTSFLRPASGDITITGRVMKPGRRLMFGEIDLVGADGKPVSHATTTYAML